MIMPVGFGLQKTCIMKTLRNFVYINAKTLGVNAQLFAALFSEAHVTF
jgi:hypothetical protein